MFILNILCTRFKLYSFLSKEIHVVSIKIPVPINTDRMNPKKYRNQNFRLLNRYSSTVQLITFLSKNIASPSPCTLLVLQGAFKKLCPSVLRSAALPSDYQNPNSCLKCTIISHSLNLIVPFITFSKPKRLCRFVF